MATLKPETFKKAPTLLPNVRKALNNLTGMHNTDKDDNYAQAPFKLNADRDLLKSSYREIWRLCTVVYDPEEQGAEMEANHQITLGPFCLGKTITVMDLEKIILHEFLHDALQLDVTDTEFVHGQINHIIRDNLHYPPPPNPANPAED